MKRFPGLNLLPILALAGVFLASGCHSNQNQNAQQATQNETADPASANLAPASDTGSTGQDQYTADSDYGETPEYTADQPPPPLPDYDQPPDPGDDYIWTPGYWAYGPQGYYWVPGAWVQAPYQDALWTPGYWGYYQNVYCFFPGYWGQNIGFYGGINYGYGYTGVGYQGGYWSNGHFDYNRSVNNINVSVVHNYYSRPVMNAYVTTNSRVSYNGGSGGIQVRPRPQELAALREPHAPPMQAQVEIQHQSSANRAQFVAVNHGRPADAVSSKPLMADRDVRPAPPPAMRNQPQAPEQQRPGTQKQPQHGPQPQQRTAPQQSRTPPVQEHSRMPEQRPAPQPRTARAPQQRPAPQQHPAMPQQHPAPQPQRPAPAPQHAAPPRPAPQPRPQEQKRPDQHPQ